MYSQASRIERHGCGESLSGSPHGKPERDSPPSKQVARLQIVKKKSIRFRPRKNGCAFFARGDLYFSRDSHLCFVCGAADPKPREQPKLRRQLLDLARDNEKKLFCVLAENAVIDLLRQVDERHKNNDLGVIENIIASAVCSLLLFRESPGSFAELGLFSANEAICKKMLTAVLAEYQGDSFITLGPIKAVGLKSYFFPANCFEGALQRCI